MKIRFLFFAQLKEVFGESERVVEIAEGATVGSVTASLLDASASETFRSLPMRFAVNEDFRATDYELSDNDVVALIPPVSGG